MAKCTNCGKSGLFLKLTKDGLCNDCDSLSSNSRKINNSEKTITYKDINDEKLDKSKLTENQNFDSELSIDELEVLVKFLKPIPQNYLNSLYWKLEWEEISKKSLSKTIQELIENKFIESPKLPNILDYAFKISELKELCRERDLKPTGKKAELIERLISNDEIGMKLSVNKLKLLMSSETGIKLAQDYLLEKEKEKELAKHSILMALEKKDLGLAIRTMIDYEVNQFFQRGINIDWKNEKEENHLPILSSIFSDTPTILKNIALEKLEPIRVIAGFNYLWSEPFSNQLSEYEEVSNKYNIQVCADMLFSNSKNKNEILEIFETYRISPTNFRKKMRVKILTCNDDLVCEDCKIIAGRNYKPDGKIPEVPNPYCSCENGCRCGYGLDIDY